MLVKVVVLEIYTITMKMNILFIYADSQREWNCSQWRSLTPSEAFNQHSDGQHTSRCIPVDDFIQYGHPVIQRLVSFYNIILVQRNIFHKVVWDACDYWRILGKTVVADLDDDYPGLTAQNPAHNFWKGQAAEELSEGLGQMPIQALEEGLRHFDALLSPNDLILQDWSHVLPGYRLPNFAQSEWYDGVEQKPTPVDEEEIIIGWGGSVSHLDSWWFSGALEAMPIIFERYPQVKFKLCGNDQRMRQLVKERWPEGRWVIQEGVPPKKWPGIVATFDVGVAPLCGPGAPQAEAYDQRRSWIKALEYMLCGVPWVATGGIVYEELDGKGGFTLKESGVDAWVEGLSTILDDLDGWKNKVRPEMQWAYDNLTMKAKVEWCVKLFSRINAEKQARDGLILPNIVVVKEKEEVEAE